jgi:beta-lactamase superfamily II metal-dependent hydrolase
MPSLIIFDVGHGSCALMQDGAVRTLFDCKDATMLIEFLLAHDVRQIDQVVISHTDEDHIAGVSALIQSDYVNVGAVFVNADARKNTDVWQELKIALQDAAENKGLRVVTGIGASMPHPPVSESVRIELVAPGIAWRLTSHGGTLPDGSPLNNANSMSVVVRLHHNEHPVVLLPGDMDILALADIVARNCPLTADVLVFPHHGGHVSASSNATTRSSENAQFTADLISRTTPQMVVFSIGRGIHATPRPEIIQKIRERAATCIVACTQLSERCHAGETPQNASHLGELPAHGKSKNRCCGGSIEINLAGSDTIAGMVRQQHAEFIAKHVTVPMCAQPVTPVVTLGP